LHQSNNGGQKNTGDGTEDVGLGNDLGNRGRDSVIEVDEEAAQGVGQQIGVAEDTEGPDVGVHAGAIGSSGDEAVASNEGGSVRALASVVAALDGTIVVFAGQFVRFCSAGRAVADLVVSRIESAADTIVGQERASTLVAVVAVEDTVIESAFGGVAASTIRNARG